MREALELAGQMVESHYPRHREYKVAAALIASQAAQPEDNTVLKLLDAAFSELQHDTGPQDVEWRLQRKNLTETFGRILRSHNSAHAKKVKGERSAEQPAQGEAVAAAGLVELSNVIRQLRETGRFADEEGEATGQLEDLYAAITAPPAPAATTELIAAAEAVVKRWASPLWVQSGHTGEFIARLRAALEVPRG